jgi:hypothetical protein
MLHLLVPNAELGLSQTMSISFNTIRSHLKMRWSHMWIYEAEAAFEYPDQNVLLDSSDYLFFWAALRLW